MNRPNKLFMNSALSTEAVTSGGEVTNRASWIRTSECSSQSAEPSRLAIAL